MSIPLAGIDIGILVVYVLLVFGIGLYLSRRASRSTEEFFVSGRSLPWWIIGTSMVATTFAADTPLVVSGLAARGGIYGNWLWWQYGIGGIAAVFLFARLWRRAGITTDAELIELRYGGRPATALRAYKAAWFGLFQNVIIIAWVMKAMAKIVIVVMGWNGGMTIMGMGAEVFIVLALFSIVVAYTVLSGLWGVVITDVLQFAVAMGASIYLAVAVLQRLGGISGISGAMAAQGFDLAETLRMVPRAASIWRANPFTEFLLLVGVVWWASYNIDGGGYLAQRLFAAKNERHSAFGFLWYVVAHICLRPWPWIIVGLGGMALFGAMEDPELYYPMVMRSLLPPGIFGLAIASFFAAFMSTIDTQLNWGSSLLVNDLYRRFFRKDKTEREYILAARCFVVLLAVFGALGSFAVKDISLAWKLVYSITAGIGTVYIARWYWWRVNAWSEISAMAAALLCTIILALLGRSARFAGASITTYPYSLALTMAVSVPVWIITTFATRSVDKDHLLRFYERVRPGGLGWRVVAGHLPGFDRDAVGKIVLLKVAAGVIILNSILIGTGKLILGDRSVGAMLLGLAALAGAALVALMRRSTADADR
jgi:SSS family solute:Na+ symporter